MDQRVRAAVIIHEMSHSIASALHFANDWPWPNGTRDAPLREGVLHPRDYAHLLPNEAAKNACSYAAFASNAFFGWDSRFGWHNPIFRTNPATTP
jgi:hypothetical protein